MLLSAPDLCLLFSLCIHTRPHLHAKEGTNSSTARSADPASLQQLGLQWLRDFALPPPRRVALALSSSLLHCAALGQVTHSTRLKATTGVHRFYTSLFSGGRSSACRS